MAPKKKGRRMAGFGGIFRKKVPVEPDVFDVDESLVVVIRLCLVRLQKLEAHHKQGIFRVEGVLNDRKALVQCVKNILPRLCVPRTEEREAARMELCVAIQKAPMKAVEGTLKYLLGKLREPLVDKAALERKRSLLEGEVTLAIEQAREWIHGLDGYQAELARHLLDYLVIVDNYSHENSMDAKNLATTPRLHALPTLDLDNPGGPVIATPPMIVPNAITYWSLVRGRLRDYVTLPNAVIRGGTHGALVLGRAPETLGKVVFLFAADTPPAWFNVVDVQPYQGSEVQFQMEYETDEGYGSKQPLSFTSINSARTFWETYQDVVDAKKRVVHCVSVGIDGRYDHVLAEEAFLCGDVVDTVENTVVAVRPWQWSSPELLLGSRLSGNATRCHIFSAATPADVPHRSGITVEVRSDTSAEYRRGAEYHVFPPRAGNAPSGDAPFGGGGVAHIVLHGTSHGRVTLVLGGDASVAVWRWVQAAVTTASEEKDFGVPSPPRPGYHLLMPTNGWNDGTGTLPLCPCGEECLSTMYTCAHCLATFHADCYFSSEPCLGPAQTQDGKEIPITIFTDNCLACDNCQVVSFPGYARRFTMDDGDLFSGRVLDHGEMNINTPSVGRRAQAIPSYARVNVAVPEVQADYSIAAEVRLCPKKVRTAHDIHMMGEEALSELPVVQARLELSGDPDKLWKLKYDDGADDGIFGTENVQFIGGGLNCALVTLPGNRVEFLNFPNAEQAVPFRNFCLQHIRFGDMSPAAQQELGPMERELRWHANRSMDVRESLVKLNMFADVVVGAQEKARVERVLQYMTKWDFSPWIVSFDTSRTQMDNSRRRCAVSHQGIVSFCAGGDLAYMRFQLVLEFLERSRGRVVCLGALSLIRGKASHAPRVYAFHLTHDDLRHYGVLPDSAPIPVPGLPGHRVFSYIHQEFEPVFYATPMPMTEYAKTLVKLVERARRPETEQEQKIRKLFSRPDHTALLKMFLDDLLTALPDLVEVDCLEFFMALAERTQRTRAKSPEREALRLATTKWVKEYSHDAWTESMRAGFEWLFAQVGETPAPDLVPAAEYDANVSVKSVHDAMLQLEETANLLRLTGPLRYGAEEVLSEQEVNKVSARVRVGLNKRAPVVSARVESFLQQAPGIAAALHIDLLREFLQVRLVKTEDMRRQFGGMTDLLRRFKVLLLDLFRGCTDAEKFCLLVPLANFARTFLHFRNHGAFNSVLAVLKGKYQAGGGYLQDVYSKVLDLVVKDSRGFLNHLGDPFFPHIPDPLSWMAKIRQSGVPGRSVGSGISLNDVSEHRQWRTRLRALQKKYISGSLQADKPLPLPRV